MATRQKSKSTGTTRSKSNGKAPGKLTKMDILQKVASGEIQPDDATKLLQDVTGNRGLYCKVSQKGAISVYGLQRMPVTLYVEQWGRLLDFADDIRAFAKENDGELKRKGDK